MTERSKVIFGNPVGEKAYRKAVRSKQNYIKKFGDDAGGPGRVTGGKSGCPVIVLGVYDVRVETCRGRQHRPFGEERSGFDLKKGLIVGNIRMGFGHYRISMAMASAAHALGYTPYWMDLNSYPETSCTKVISAQNDLYSHGLQTLPEEPSVQCSVLGASEL